jgi:hypothetical protein
LLHLLRHEGRKAGTVEGYSYSPANKSSGITWDEQSFPTYIRAPMQKIPGTKMTFVGIKNAKKWSGRGYSSAAKAFHSCRVFKLVESRIPRQPLYGLGGFEFAKSAAAKRSLQQPQQRLPGART